MVQNHKGIQGKDTVSNSIWKRQNLVEGRIICDEDRSKQATQRKKPGRLVKLTAIEWCGGGNKQLIWSKHTDVMYDTREAINCNDINTT